MESAYCNKCSQNLPLSEFGINSDRSIRPQCKKCRSATDKITRDWKAACCDAIANGQMPPPKPTPLAVSTRPNGGLNDIECDLCGLKTKRQNLDLHKKWIQHRIEDPPQCCDLCDFKTDCLGHLRYHKLNVHKIETPIPHRTKALWTCTTHLHDIKRACQSQYYKTDEQREKSRKRYADRPLTSCINKRVATSNRDASENRRLYLQGCPDPRGPNYCDMTPLRRYQKCFQEKSLRTRNMRIESRYRNFCRVREMFRRHHQKYRTQRNEANATYRYKNRRLKMQQIQYQAKMRGMDFILSEDVVFRLINQPCFYCNVLPDKSTRSGLHGLDRVDNTKGYIMGNVVPCCPACNTMKGALDVEAFLCQVDKIYRHMQLNTTEYVDEPKRKFNATDFEDKILQWLQGVTQSILTNIEMVKEIIKDSHIDPLALFNHRSRNILKKKLEWVRKSVEIVSDIPNDYMANNENMSGVIVARTMDKDFAEKTLLDMLKDIDQLFSEFTRLQKKRYHVKWAGNAQWKLSDEEAVALIFKSECTYCGMVGDLGIDRIDPKGAYEMGNVVSACGSCNIMRSDLQVSMFLLHVKDIYETLQLTSSVRAAVSKRQRHTNIPIFNPNNGVVPRDSLNQTTQHQQAHPQRYMRISSTGLMVLNNRHDHLTIHTRVCGKGAIDRWRVVDVAEVNRQYTGVQQCKLCSTTDPDAPDCCNNLPDIPRITNYDDLVDGLRKRRADEFVVTDLQKIYHTQDHGNNKYEQYVVPRHIVDAYLPDLKACKMCVGVHPSNSVFDGQVDLPRIECETQLRGAQLLYRQKHQSLRSATNSRYNKTVTITPKRVVDVFLCQTNSNIYHTTIHGNSSKERTKIQTFANLSEKTKGKLKPCTKCVTSIGGDVFTLEDAIRQCTA